MTQPIPPITPVPTVDELAALYSACVRRDMQAADEVAAAINVRLNIGDDETPEWLLDLVAAGIAAQLAEQSAESGQACAA